MYKERQGITPWRSLCLMLVQSGITFLLRWHEPFQHGFVTARCGSTPVF